MEVRLSNVQHRCLRMVLAGQSTFTSWLDEGERAGETYWRVVMPAIAWQRSIDLIAGMAFNPAGQRRGKVPRAATRALMSIARAMVARKAHPALRGMALPEWSNEIIPAWRIKVDEFSIFPRPDCPYVVLVPRWEKLTALEITRWVPGEPPIQHRLFNEHEHLAFGYYPE